MIKLKNFLIILFATFLNNKLESYIQEACILNNEKVNIVLLGDRHLPHAKSKQQVYDIFKAIKELNACLIIEDSEEDIDNLEIVEKIELKSATEFLDPKKRCLNPLGYLCKTSNLDYHNVEFRGIWSAFRANFIKLEDAIKNSKAILNELKDQFNDLCSSKEVKEKLINICQEIENDPSWDILNKYKDLKFNEFIEKISIQELYTINGMNFKNESYKKKLLAKCCKNKLKKNFWDISIPYLTLTHRIIELQVVKEVFKNQNKKNIFICAGAYHTRLIKEVFGKWETVTSCDATYKKYNCLCTFNCCYCYCEKNSKALDIKKFLQDFMDQNRKEAEDEKIWVV